MKTILNNTAEIDSLNRDWREAVESGKVAMVTRLYHEKASLWGAFTNKACYNLHDIRTYYRRLLNLEGLSVEFIDKEVRLLDDVAVSTGIMRCDYYEDDFRKSKVLRFSFTYVYEQGHWLIASEHASILSDNNTH